MINKINLAMNYFIEYETHNRLNNVSIEKIDNISISLDKLNDFEYIKNYLDSKKKFFIKNIIKDIKNLDSVSKELLNLEKETKESFKLNVSEILKSYYGGDKFLNIKTNQITKGLYNDEITVLYPIYQLDGKLYPLIASYCKIADDKLYVEKYKVSEALLDSLSLSENLGDLEEHLGGKKEKEEFFQALNSINNPNVTELNSLISEELQNRMPVLIDAIQNGRWEQAVITIDELKEVRFNPFKEEMNLLKNVYADSDDSIVEKYIFPEDNRKHVKDLSFNSHFGSYTGEYSVNEKQWKVVNSVRNNQLISVTGPPGTGKTTVLKEIIADSFVEKTKRITELWNSEWKEINNNIKIFQSPLEGSNFKSMIVTSTNNEAVDNIGQEINREIRYFLNNNDKDDISSFCAKLGNQNNMKTFIKNVLNKKIKMLREFRNLDEDDTPQLIEKFNKLYKEIQNFNELSNSYRDYKNELINKYSLNTEDVAYESILQNIKELEDAINGLNNEINKLRQEIVTYDSNIEILTKSNRDDNDVLEKAKIDEVALLTKFEKYNKIAEFKILGQVIARIVYGDVRVINLQLDGIKTKILDLNSSIDHRKERISEFKDFQEKNKIEARIKEEEIERRRLKIEDYNTYLSKYDSFQEELDNLNISISPDETEFNTYNNEIILSKRNFLFNISLRINESYIFQNKDKIINNLEYIYHDEKWFKRLYSSEYKYSTDKENNIRSIWETFCLCFPVITTTLNSFEKNKFHMIKELFDTLLVDEAGQVLPYYLLSPLYRVKKAVIVGDVLQLQPIRKGKINIFNKYEEQLPHYLNADISSAQHYSHMSSDVYELLKKKDSGIILEEHRRCEKAIAAFSNEYVYHGVMDITKENKEKEFLKSNVCFIDIRGEKSKYNTNESEVRICKAIVEELLHEYKPEDIGIITPYKNQKNKISKEVDKNIDVGTVHAFQGKGKEVIIMSMVTSSIDDKAGIKFIGGEPNFLNVAFTRAKKQLIIIGNYELLDNAKGNYLESMNSFINDYGRIYSIYYDNILDNVEPKYLNQFYRVISYGNEITASKYNMLFNDYIDAKGLIIDDNHYKLLINLFNYAEKRIEVVSPWITSTVIDNNFFNEIKEFIANNKRYRIIFGYNKTKHTLNTNEEIQDIMYKDSAWKNKLTEDIQLVKDLKSILKDDLVYRPPLHTKAIIVDNEYLIIGSHNWLSKKGQRSNARHELSCIIKDKGMINFLINKWK